MPTASSAAASKLVAAALVVAVGGGSAWWYATSIRGNSIELSTSVVANAESAPASEELTAREPRPAAPNVLVSIPRDPAGARADAGPAPGGGLANEADSTVASSSGGSVLRGRVALHDDAPLARVGVDVVLESPLDPSDSSGAVEGSAKTDTDGTFRIEGLRPGSYRLSVTWNDDLPVLGSPIFATRQESHDVVVEAHVIDVAARSDRGDLMPMRSIQMLNVREARDFDGGAMVFRAMLPEHPVHHLAVAPVGSRYVVSAEGLDDEEYFGIFEPKSAPGKVELVLSRHHPAFGSLEVVVESEALPATAKLIHLQAAHSDLAIMVTGRHEPSHDGRTSVRYPALLPGRYRFEHVLEDAGHVAITDDPTEIDVDAGSSRTVVLDAYVGGVLELVVSTSLPLGRRAFADLAVRRGAEWTDRSFLTVEEYEGGATLIRGSRVLVGGPVATSSPWPVGEYEVRISLDGHGAETRTVRLLEGVTERLEVTLDPL